MHADPLFVDLRIAMANAKPIQELLSGHLAAGDKSLSSLTPPQRVLLNAGLAQMVQSIYVAAENMLLKIAASIDGGAPAKEENWHSALLAARRLGWHLPQVDHLFDMRHASRLDQLETAARSLGREIRMSVS